MANSRYNMPGALHVPEETFYPRTSIDEGPGEHSADTSSVASDIGYFDSNRLAEHILYALGEDIGHRIASFIRYLDMPGHYFMSLNSHGIAVLSEDNPEVTAALYQLRGENYRTNISTQRRYSRPVPRVDAVFPNLHSQFQRIRGLSTQPGPTDEQETSDSSDDENSSFEFVFNTEGEDDMGPQVQTSDLQFAQEEIVAESHITPNNGEASTGPNESASTSSGMETSEEDSREPLSRPSESTESPHGLGQDAAGNSAASPRRRESSASPSNDSEAPHNTASAPADSHAHPPPAPNVSHTSSPHDSGSSSGSSDSESPVLTPYLLLNGGITGRVSPIHRTSSVPPELDDSAVFPGLGPEDFDNGSDTGSESNSDGKDVEIVHTDEEFSQSEEEEEEDIPVPISTAETPEPLGGDVHQSDAPSGSNVNVPASLDEHERNIDDSQILTSDSGSQTSLDPEEREVQIFHGQAQTASSSPSIGTSYLYPRTLDISISTNLQSLFDRDIPNVRLASDCTYDSVIIRNDRNEHAILFGYGGSALGDFSSHTGVSAKKPSRDDQLRHRVNLSPSQVPHDEADSPITETSFPILAYMMNDIQISSNDHDDDHDDAHDDDHDRPMARSNEDDDDDDDDSSIHESIYHPLQLSLPPFTLIDDLEQYTSGIANEPELPDSQKRRSFNNSLRTTAPLRPQTHARRTRVIPPQRTLWVPHDSRLESTAGSSSKKGQPATSMTKREQQTTYADKLIQTDEDAEIKRLRRKIRVLKNKAVEQEKKAKDPAQRRRFLACLFPGDKEQPREEREMLVGAGIHTAHPSLLMK